MKVITGSTGGVGGRAVEVLASKGYPLRLLVRDPARAPRLPNTEVIKAAYDEADALPGGLKAGDEVFMVSVNLPHDERMAQHAAFVAAAAGARVGHIVYLSFVEAGPTAKFPHCASHGETEELIRATGIPFTFLRTNYYHEVAGGLHMNGVMLGKGGKGKVAWVDRMDCGDVVAAVMADTAAHAGRTYDVTGPEALTLDDTSRLISDTLGLDYRYVDEDYDPEEMSARTGAPLGFMKHRRGAFEGISLGEFAKVTDVIPRLLGRPAVSLAAFIKKTPQAFPAAK